ncbi:MAG: hypothetical protein GF401_20235 [Chitinivibrionales bacterium]|nr:hypothetical protein [Chitinivibrionales bacterium]
MQLSPIEAHSLQITKEIAMMGVGKKAILISLSITFTGAFMNSCDRTGTNPVIDQSDPSIVEQPEKLVDESSSSIPTPNAAPLVEEQPVWKPSENTHPFGGNYEREPGEKCVYDYYSHFGTYFVQALPYHSGEHSSYECDEWELVDKNENMIFKVHLSGDNDCLLNIHLNLQQEKHKETITLCP